MQQLRSQVSQVASSNLGRTDFGGNGTGKELVANAIHHQSQRSRKPLIRLNVQHYRKN